MNEYRQKTDENEKKEFQNGVSRRSFLATMRGLGLFTANSMISSGSQHSSETSKDDIADEATLGPEAHKIQLKVNGFQHEVTVEPNETLADVLRDHLHLTGTKVVCDRGTCSSCTVLLDGKPVNSCMTLILDTIGKEITTIESLAGDGKLHPLQQAFIDHDATQCGFCTPGMLMSSIHLLNINPYPTLEEIKTAISGNLCRCGTHPHVFKALLEVSKNNKRH